MRHFIVLFAALLLAACVSDSPLNKGNPKEAAHANTSLAIEYARAGNFELALEKAKRALAQDDDYALAHSTIALLYAQRGEDAEAIKHYRRAISLDSHDLYTRNNFAIFECERGRIDEALELFESVAKDKSYNSPAAAYINAGVCANRAERGEQAERYFREALTLSPDNPEALLQLAVLAAKKQDWLKVRAFLQRRDTLAKPTAGSLQLGIKAERMLGDMAAVERLSQQLRRDFP